MNGSLCDRFWDIRTLRNPRPAKKNIAQLVWPVHCIGATCESVVIIIVNSIIPQSCNQ